MRKKITVKQYTSKINKLIENNKDTCVADTLVLLLEEASKYEIVGEKTVNKRQLGNTLEDYVVSKLRTSGDRWAKRSPSSGATGTRSDVICKRFQIECKKRNTKNFTFNISKWNKLCTQLPHNSEKVPLFVNENIDGKRFVTLDIEDFFRLLKRK